MGKKVTNHERLGRVYASIVRRNQSLEPLLRAGVVERDGERYLKATVLASFLGYETLSSFRPCIDRAQITAGNSGVPIALNFVEGNLHDGQVDVFLTEWATYATILEADPRKPTVALAKSFFASVAQKRLKREETRIKERYIFKTLHKRLHAAADAAGVHDQQHAIFDDHGYRGFYGMTLRGVEKHKGVPADESLIDHADETELTANNLRMSLAADRIVKNRIDTAAKANAAYFDVSRIVRRAVIDANDVAPENLPLAKESINALTKRKRDELELGTATRQITKSQQA